MNIQLVRIDDRLIHGQVVVGWVTFLSAERIIVINDLLAHDTTQQTLMRMAVPEKLVVEFMTIEGGAHVFQKDQSTKKAILIFSNPLDILTFVKLGCKLETINVGGMHYCEGKVQICRDICVTKEEVEAFKKLKSFHINLEIQAVPGDPKEMLEKYLPEIKL